MCTSNSDLNNRRRYPHGYTFEIDEKKHWEKQQREQRKQGWWFRGLRWVTG